MKSRNSQPKCRDENPADPCQGTVARAAYMKNQTEYMWLCLKHQYKRETPSVDVYTARLIDWVEEETKEYLDKELEREMEKMFRELLRGNE